MPSCWTGLLVNTFYSFPLLLMFFVSVRNALLPLLTLQLASPPLTSSGEFFFRLEDPVQ